MEEVTSSYKSMEVPRYCQNINTIIYFAVLIVVAKEDVRPMYYKNRVNAGLHVIDGNCSG